MSGTIKPLLVEPLLDESPSGEQSTAAQISNLVVGLLHTYTGRGPTKAWTSIDADLVSVVLHDTLSKGEHSLANDSQAPLVLEMRRAYQETMRPELIAGVQETHRTQGDRVSQRQPPRARHRNRKLRA